jgi:hypothetical protein
MGTAFPWSASVEQTTVSPLDSGRQVELKSPSPKSEGGRRGMSPSWYCHATQSALYSLTMSRTAR